VVNTRLGFRLGWSMAGIGIDQAKYVGTEQVDRYLALIPRRGAGCSSAKGDRPLGDRRACLSEGVGAIPWWPLARGRLTRPWSDAPPTTRAESDNYARSLFASTSAIGKPVVDCLYDVARKRRLPSSQIALAWMLNNPAITAPIIGATKMEHLGGAVAALSVTLSKDEIGHLDELPLIAKPIGGALQSPPWRRLYDPHPTPS
jgi:Aldo/keto reductase family